MTTLNILVLNGPNLNLLGQREIDLYGDKSLDDLENRLLKMSHQYQKKANIYLEFYQSNHEGDLIDKIHELYHQSLTHSLIIFNPAGYTHTSIALRDALLATAIPFIEVHLTDLNHREKYRQHSYFSDIAIQTISGYKLKSYELALDAAIEYFGELI